MISAFSEMKCKFYFSGKDVKKNNMPAENF